MPDRDLRSPATGSLKKSVPATEALEEAGIPYAIHTIAPPSDSRHLKTVLAVANANIISATFPANAELDLAALASAVGASSARLATREDADSVTESDLADVSPLGLPSEAMSILDVSVTAYVSVQVPSGLSGLGIEILADHLIDMTRGRTAPIT